MIRAPGKSGFSKAPEGQTQMKTFTSLTALLLLSGTALAANQSDFYANGGGGIYRLKAAGFDDTGATTKLVGGYHINPYVAVEGGYLKMFTTSDVVDGTRVKIDGDAWEVGTKLSYPFNNKLSGYGRLGWSFYDLTAKVQDEDLQMRLNENSDAPTWALGGRMNINPRLALNGEYSRILVANTDADFISADLSYRFGSR